MLAELLRFRGIGTLEGLVQNKTINKQATHRLKLPTERGKEGIQPKPKRHIAQQELLEMMISSQSTSKGKED